MAVKYDIFIAPRTYGFQTFENSSSDCWPIVALNYNRQPNKRYLMKNIMLLGFLKWPKEPEHIGTWFTPLAEEINAINKSGGIAIKFYDDIERKVRVHVIHETGDKPAVNTQTRLVRQNGRCPCWFCVLCSRTRNEITY